MGIYDGAPSTAHSSLACNEKHATFISEQPDRFIYGHVRDALYNLLDKIVQTNCRYSYGSYCAPLVADYFLFRYKRDFMLSLSDNNQADVIEAFNSTSRYLDDFLNIDNPYFEQMVSQIIPTKLQLNKANSSDTDAPFLDLDLSITNGIVSTKIYDKRDDFNFE